ncbi:histidine kinase [uncultured Bacteroides sp.]|uniref:tetratricopeptide repeat-containing sensor histidine kinase n=1 Tax=uncultured Bacteroides sp. TaxID=162156 RepID=UPI002AA8BC0C|nr:histidine kinase [uncultured Bacteroides sp.]
MKKNDTDTIYWGMMGIIKILVILTLSACHSDRTKKELLEQKADSTLNEGRKTLFTDIPLSKHLLKEAMNCTEDSMKYYDAYEAYSTCYFMENKYDSAITMKKKALAFLEKQIITPRRQELLASVNNSFGAYHSLMNQPDSAIIYFKKALRCPPSKESKPDIYINLADQYKTKGDLATAAYYLRLGLSISDSLDLKKFKFPICYGLADIYLGLRDFKQANEYYLRAEKDYKSRRFDEKVLFCNNRGNYYYYKKEYSNALQWFKRAEKYLANTDYDYFKNMVNANLADVYLNLNELDSCNLYIKKAEPYFKKINHKSILYYINTVKIGLAIAQNNYSLASKLQQEIKGDKDIEPNIVSIRTKYLENLSLKKNNYKEAYGYLAKNTLLNDSLRNDITQKRIAELDMHYKQDSTLIKKDLFIQRQSAEVKTFKLSTYIWILISVLIVSGTFFGYYIIKKKNNIQRMKYMEQITKLRISNIRNRISPHFMFNVLNNEMQGLDEEKKERLYTLAHLLRISLEMAEQISIKLSDEIDFVKAYIELSKQKVGDNFTMIWEISPLIDLDNMKIIPMMLQIPIENALKHGLSQIKGEKKLTVKIFREDQGIRIFVVDNGKGYHPNDPSPTTGTGTGLRVLNQTMQILNAKNTRKIIFAIHNIDKAEETGTKIEIYIPYHYKFEYK